MGGDVTENGLEFAIKIAYGCTLANVQKKCIANNMRKNVKITPWRNSVMLKVSWKYHLYIQVH